MSIKKNTIPYKKLKFYPYHNFLNKWIVWSSTNHVRGIKKLEERNET